MKTVVQRWLEDDYDPETKKEIKRLAEEDPEGLQNAFYTRLEFGTGGLRGLMGVGSNRMNVYTIRFATQGLANYLKEQISGEIRVLIGYDSRNNSRLFAEETARVLAGNQIHAHIYEELRPVPLVSFGCRHKRCHAGIMITASHNPPEYNGYKVYWSDGGQILPPHDLQIISEVNKIESPSQVSLETIDSPFIKWIGTEIDTAYLDAIEKLKTKSAPLSIVYTPIHGTGITLIPEALKRWGYNDVTIVNSQKIPDGNFPTVDSPNPENHAALKLGTQKLQEVNGDILLATDPDADRVGVAVMHQNEVYYLNGNEIACLCLEHIMQSENLPKNAAFVKTIVTTELFQAICDHYGYPCYNTLTGFKYIGELITKWNGNPQFIFGGEESYGYLLGDHARDKDAIVSCCLIAEVAANAKLEEKTLIDRLEELQAKYGHYQETLHSLNFPETQEGRAKMSRAMKLLREHSPKEIAGTTVLFREDYLNSTRTNLKTGETTPLNLPQSNVFVFELEDNARLIVRPSGTEPKIKLYIGVRGEVELNKFIDSIKKFIIV